MPSFGKICIIQWTNIFQMTNVESHMGKKLFKVQDRHEA